MAQRSTGLFPREGFNLDEEMKTTVAGATLPANLHNTKTVRVICFGAVADTVATIGGVAVELHSADADLNGIVIAHVRGALLADEPNGTVVTVTGTAYTGSIYFEKVEA